MSQGYKLVPINPTAGMIAAGMQVFGATARYSAMLAAAPVPPGMEVEVLAWYLPDEDVKPAATVRWDVAKFVPEATELVDRAHITRLQAENAALQQRLTIADQRIDDLERARAQSLEVNPTSLRALLNALVGAPHEIRELQAWRGIPDNPIDQLLREYNAWTNTPAPASQQ